MRYKWKPTAAQKAEYKRKCQEKETLLTKGTIYPIRKGCFVEFYSMNSGKVISGEVTNSSYGQKTNQHTFTITTSEGDMVIVKGRNLYPNIIKHTQGEESKKQSMYA
jgi:hypothetical protein